MAENDSGAVIRLERAQDALKGHFLGWQCRLRQLAVREAGGRPTGGMRPLVQLPDEADRGYEITVLIVKQFPEDSTAQFRHLARRTHDPAERYKKAIEHLAAAYYQRPEEFSDELTALFAPGARLTERLLDAGNCRLGFEQYSQRYLLPCRTRALAESEPAYQATYWHNILFNAAIPAGAQILGFQPDWATAEADPPAA